MKTIKVFTAFSGYDSQCMALDRLSENNPDFNYKLVGWSEIDKYAIQAHNAIYPQYSDINFGDIKKIDWHQVPDFDLFTYSSPCQDFSQAGLQRGGEIGTGTRSSLLWECERAIAIKKPKYLLFENVTALVSQKFIKTFQLWQCRLQHYGYVNFCQVLNAKDYGVPQNRERIFMLSILNCETAYNFPQPFPLVRRLADVLDTNVPETFYLSDDKVKSLNINYSTKEEGNTSTIQLFNILSDDNRKFTNPQRGRVYSVDSCAPCLNTCTGGGLEPKILTKERTEYGKLVRKDYEDGKIYHTRDLMQQYTTRKDGLSNTITTVEKDNLLLGVSVNPLSRKLEFKGVESIKQISPTLTAHDAIGASCVWNVKDFKLRIRKLTPNECFKLMGVNWKYRHRLTTAGISNHQLYKMAGNSIVVDVLYWIFYKLFIDQVPDNGQLSIFDVK